jgi:hypothetical protein
MFSISLESVKYRVLDATMGDGSPMKVLVFDDVNPALGENGPPVMRVSIPLDEAAARNLGSMLKGERVVELARPEIIIPDILTEPE